MDKKILMGLLSKNYHKNLDDQLNFEKTKSMANESMNNYGVDETNIELNRYTNAITKKSMPSVTKA